MDLKAPGHPGRLPRLVLSPWSPACCCLAWITMASAEGVQPHLSWREDPDLLGPRLLISMFFFPITIPIFLRGASLENTGSDINTAAQFSLWFSRPQLGFTSASEKIHRCGFFKTVRASFPPMWLLQSFLEQGNVKIAACSWPLGL